MTDPTSPDISKRSAFHIPFAVMTILFFIWGFITALNDILIPHLKATFDLNYTQAMLVQFCFFGAYFLISPLAGKLIAKIGYMRGIITGLSVMATGCILFYPAAELAIYALFLLALFILASGITILQVSANPYVAILGPQETSASRLNFAQAINSLGHTLAPQFGAILIFGALHSENLNAKSVQLPYIILAVFIIITALVFKFLHLPDVEAPQAEHSTPRENDSIWHHKTLLFGALAIFLYVGAEVSIGSFLVNYFSQSNIGDLSEHQASRMVSYYWGAAMIGRFVGAALTRVISPAYVLAANALLAITMVITSIQTTGDVAMWTIIAVGFFNSIMFPTIFSLAIRGLGSITSLGSGLLCQAIVGGAIMPLFQGYAADTFGIQLSFFVPALAYVYIAWYAVRAIKKTSLKTLAEVDS